MSWLWLLLGLVTAASAPPRHELHTKASPVVAPCVAVAAIAYERAVVGRETVVMRGGKEVERRITPSDSMLALLVKRGEMGDGNEDGGAAALPPLRMRKRRRPCGQRRLSGQGCYRQA